MNSALMALRRKRNHPEYSLDEIADEQPDSLGHLAVDRRPNPEQICAIVELTTLIKEQVLRLPEPERAAFLHYAIHSHSTKESCLTFGVPASTFKSRMLRTRRKLAHGLQHPLGKVSAASPKGKSHHVAQL
ncbi:MAG: RNA polymerase sigma factor [Terracidiphilus sp.]